VCWQILKQVQDDAFIIGLPYSERHAELVSASHVFDGSHVRQLKQTAKDIVENKHKNRIGL
jgi:hypothetical protein